jgi:hypothetical protein
MIELTTDVIIAGIFVALWLVAIPVLRRVMPRVARGDEVGSRAILGEIILMLHVIILVLAIIGVVNTALDVAAF